MSVIPAGNLPQGLDEADYMLTAALADIDKARHEIRQGFATTAYKRIEKARDWLYEANRIIGPYVEKTKTGEKK